jgi:hypothetical protein
MPLMYSIETKKIIVTITMMLILKLKTDVLNM